MTSVQDSIIFRNILSTTESAKIWNDETRTYYYLLFEACLAKAQARLDIIPQHAADEIVKAARLDIIDWEQLGKTTELIGYSVYVLSTTSCYDSILKSRVVMFSLWILEYLAFRESSLSSFEYFYDQVWSPNSSNLSTFSYTFSLSPFAHVLKTPCRQAASSSCQQHRTWPRRMGSLGRHNPRFDRHGDHTSTARYS